MSEKQQPKPAPLPTPEMAEVRENIDQLDKQLVALLRARLNWVEQAGKVKKQRQHVVDEARIEEVVQNVLREAKKQGLPEGLTEKLWRLLIDQSIEHEYSIYDAKSADKD